MSNAIKAEAAAEPVPIVFDGDTYEVPPSDQWDLDALEAIEAGQITRGVRLILGDDQYKAFRKTHGKVGQLNDLFGVINEAIGGNS